MKKSVYIALAVIILASAAFSMLTTRAADDSRSSSLPSSTRVTTGSHSINYSPAELSITESINNNLQPPLENLARISHTRRLGVGNRLITSLDELTASRIRSWAPANVLERYDDAFFEGSFILSLNFTTAPRNAPYGFIIDAIQTDGDITLIEVTDALTADEDSSEYAGYGTVKRDIYYDMERLFYETDTWGILFEMDRLLLDKGFAITRNGVIVASVPPARPSYHSDQPGIEVNGTAISFPGQQPLIKSGRTFVPVRSMFEELGFSVEWNQSMRHAVLQNSDYTVVITEDSDIFTVNGTSHDLGIRAQIINGRLIIPLRAVLESIGYTVIWDGTRSAVSITPSNHPVASITINGIEYSTSLTELDLTDTRLTNSDIEPLKHMHNLTALALPGTQVSDISPLAELSNLTLVNLRGLQISDLSPLAELAGLRQFDLSWNWQISDLTPLARLANLTWLNLENSRIRDIEPLATLDNLTHLQLQGNIISDITLLTGLTNLTWLSLRGNHIGDISPLATLNSLTHLSLGSNAIKDINPLSELRGIIILTLDANPISDITPISKLTSLERLTMTQTDISDIYPLAALTNLWVLSIGKSRTGIDISPLANLTNLRHLYMDWMGLTDISPLANLTNLEELELSFNKINNAIPLANLTNLRWLFLQGNLISSMQENELRAALPDCMVDCAE